MTERGPDTRRSWRNFRNHFSPTLRISLHKQLPTSTMPRAVRGLFVSVSGLICALLTPRSVAGLLIECDPSIKSMILKYDEERHDYIVEDLDDENHLVIKESQLENLKVRLDQVHSPCFALSQTPSLTNLPGPRREDHAAR